MKTKTPFWIGSYVDTDQPGAPTLWMRDCGLCAENEYNLADEPAAVQATTEHVALRHPGVHVRIHKGN